MVHETANQLAMLLYIIYVCILYYCGHLNGRLEDLVVLAGRSVTGSVPPVSVDVDGVEQRRVIGIKRWWRGWLIHHDYKLSKGARVNFALCYSNSLSVLSMILVSIRREHCLSERCTFAGGGRCLGRRYKHFVWNIQTILTANQQEQPIRVVYRLMMMTINSIEIGECVAYAIRCYYANDDDDDGLFRKWNREMTDICFFFCIPLPYIWRNAISNMIDNWQQ